MPYIEKKISVTEKDYKQNISRFNAEMFAKIVANMKEKGLSWRNMSNEQLLPLIQKYLEKRDYVSVANIAFMLWENALKRKLRQPIIGVCSNSNK